MSSPPRSPATPPPPEPPAFTGMFSPSVRGSRPPPNSPNSSLPSPVVFRRGRATPVGPEVDSYQVDLRAINYVNEVDENLVCPICRCAFIKPVTSNCDHTFCSECINRHMETANNCPIDRDRIDQRDLIKSTSLIYNQLDSLQAICPCCEKHVERSLLGSHLEKYCLEVDTACPGDKESGELCKEIIKRKHVDKGCMHYMTICEDCNIILMGSELEDHQEKSCKNRSIKCELCNEDHLNCQKSKHVDECPEAMVDCEWKNIGCASTTRRSEQPAHLEVCAYKLLGPMSQMFQEQITNLEAKIEDVTATNQVLERRLKFLEKGEIDPRYLQETTEYGERVLQTHSTEMPDLPANVDEYLHSVIEAQTNRLTRLETVVSELDSKHRQMLYNEIVPMKADMNDLRSTVQVNSMHTRFLLRFRIQENQRRGPGGGAGVGGAGPSNGSDSGSPLPRRSSDSRERL